ncbi:MULTISPECIES: TraR/DksA family transcriptional regulator [Leptospira]|uniref:TraR/DksA family transcriptional regulator n=2 Tax=Leptospira TaxID=171 RepID=A0A6H3NK20_9LEPT|nr:MULTISPECIES: TraR/DksA family transcriptional regulator [Leptospira]MCG6153762.1 TraR/DksA family transcriptional regulator [Leptospira bandrabouensis]MCT8335538.1 TraR/DksA family transcriptional regulator [Leptospira sp. 85282-16]MCW7458044.1 TraR/DksA family transcriptional regulator [Leptospira bandrabouensis]MCW7479173.1 TraR/DksA family transcriptional regulator [Leptospira bandrabouensis]MCW7486699.1 TraR/DksA family transcriptional regulator [Leptospira bandrabouensis]
MPKPAAKSSSSEKGVDKKFIEEVRELLQEKKESLLIKLNQWEDTSSPSGLKEMGDIADIASELNSEALTSVLTENEIETLREIELALEKIENGTYGICEGTKKKIPLARLKAIPWTRFTVEFAEQMAKSRNRAGGYRMDSLSAYPVTGMDVDSLD